MTWTGISLLFPGLSSAIMDSISFLSHSLSKMFLEHLSCKNSVKSVIVLILSPFLSIYTLSIKGAGET